MERIAELGELHYGSYIRKNPLKLGLPAQHWPFRQRVRGLAALENVALWHERDISRGSIERIIFPDSCTLLDYMLVTLTKRSRA